MTRAVGHRGGTAEVPHVVAVLGRGVVDADEPVVTADDLGLTRGDGCFDSARVVTDAGGTGRVVDLDEHLARLASSAEALAIANPSRGEWPTPGEAVLKLVLTRGREWRDAGPTAIVSITHRGPSSPAAASARTITAVTLSRGHPSDAFADAPWLLGGTKTLSYVVNVAAAREARRRGADDVIFTTTDDFALDGPTSGLLVARDGAFLSTPTGGTGILESITVATILEAAGADGFATRYELIPVDDLYRADGVWLVSSGRGPVLVTSLDGRSIHSDEGLAARILRYALF